MSDLQARGLSYHDMMRDLMDQAELSDGPRRKDKEKRSYRFRPNIFRPEYEQQERKSVEPRGNAKDKTLLEWENRKSFYKEKRSIEAEVRKKALLVKQMAMLK